MEAEIYSKLLLTFGLVLLAAAIGGKIARFFKQPAVIGELLAGMIISPFALGGFINDPVILNFAVINGHFVEGGIAIPEFAPMQIIAEIAVIALLFIAGLETDVRAFIRNGVTGGLVAVGGVVLPLLFGYVAAMYFFPDIGTVGWLFVGAVLTATSIGITVRILMDMGRFNSRESIIILVAAVVDDIIGLVILSVVVSVAGSGEVNGLGIAVTALIGFAVWLALLAIGIFGHEFISKYILAPFKRSKTMPILALILTVLISYMVTLVDLHPVVGAYAAGLLFASTKEKEEIIEGARPVMLFLAPFFFAYLGMQVDLGSVWQVIVPVLVLLALAVIGKIIGCYIPARLVGRLSHNGGMIVGVGMVPRGEVGLIVASAGLLAGAISRDIFGIAVVVSILTVFFVPTMLKPLFARDAVLPAKPAKK